MRCIHDPSTVVMCNDGFYNNRQTVIDDGVSKCLTLQQWPNVVRGTDFCGRFFDAQDDPIKGIVVSLHGT